MGEYNDTFLIVDLCVLGALNVVLLIGCIAFLYFGILRWLQKGYGFTMNRLIIGMDANEEIALVDLFEADNESNRNLMMEVLNEAKDGDPSRLSELVSTRFNAGGSLNEAYAKGVQRMRRLRVAILQQKYAKKKQRMLDGAPAS